MNEPAEISDHVVDYEPDTLARRPVRKADVLGRFEALGDRFALRVLRRLPERGGVLDPDAIDALLVRAHCELQRLSEEFQQGRRVLGLLRPLVDALHASGIRPVRIVDLGCGLGFVIRWLAASGELHDVELVGCDYNAALIAVAAATAAAEGLPCRFAVGNAFAQTEPSHVIISTGVIHHFRGDDLARVFAEHAAVEAFVHHDIRPSWAAPLGSWMFHKSRMRVPLAQHDGIASAMRAHDDDTLLEAARAGCPNFRIGLYDTGSRLLPIFKVLRPVLGVRAIHEAAFVDALGPRRHLLERWS